MSAVQRMAQFGDRVFDRLRHRQAFTLTDDAAVDGDFDSLRPHKYAVLVTFRRNGEAVPSPVWFAVDGSRRVYVKTARYAGKVKRLRHDSRALIAPSNARGKPVGPAVRGHARVLPDDEWPGAERALATAYGAGRRLSERVLGSEEMAAYIEITPGH